MSLLGIQEGETFSGVRFSNGSGKGCAARCPSICGDCPWLPLGYCQRELRLRSGKKAMALIDLDTTKKDWEGGGAV
jgi:hypothetical protein